MKLSLKRSADMNRKRWANDNPAQHGSMRIAIRYLLYEWHSPTANESNYDVYLLIKTFGFRAGESKQKKDRFMLDRIEADTPNFYKEHIIRDIILYKDYRFYSKEGNLKSFAKATALSDKIWRNKKVQDKLTYVSESEAIKIWGKFVAYNIKRGNKLKVL